MRVVVPALFDVPQPHFVPHDDHAEDEAVGVVHASPAVLAELHQRRRLVLRLATSPPSLDLTLREVQLLRKTQNLETMTKQSCNYLSLARLVVGQVARNGVKSSLPKVIDEWSV